MPDGDSLRCPVCRARFRRQADCPRCGADLNVLMALAARSWQLRQAARKAIRSGDLDAAAQLADQAQQLCDTGAGRSLAALAAWVNHVLNRLGSLKPAAE